jgi:hypothetical protein
MNFNHLKYLLIVFFSWFYKSDNAYCRYLNLTMAQYGLCMYLYDCVIILVLTCTVCLDVHPRSVYVYRLILS